MAFSTQKDFFNVPFMNESVELNCRKTCVKLKSYESTIDNRAWASDETEQSKFLSDLVTCPNSESVGDGDAPNSADIIVVKSPSKGKSTKTQKLKHLASDSEYQKVLNMKTALEKELEISHELLTTAKAENSKIKKIVDSKLDSNSSKDFYNKIQKFTASGKLNKNEENEMLRIYQKMENLNKAYEILQVENDNLKLLVEKLKTRVSDKIITQPEKLADTAHLQEEINRLRKDLLALRKMENEYHSLKQKVANMMPTISEEDTASIKGIIKERNSLREQRKSFIGLEQQLKELQHQAQESKKEASELLSKLNSKKDYINKLESEMQDMQKYYDNKNQKTCFREECLKAQLEDLKVDLTKAKCEAQKSNILATEVSCLRNELLKRNMELNEYDSQFRQLMDVIDELQSMKLESLHDNETQTHKEQTDELEFYTRATLDEIIKELKTRGYFDNDLLVAHGLEQPAAGTNVTEKEKACCQEMKIVQNELDEMKTTIANATNGETVDAHALKRLEQLEIVNAKLLDENQSLREKLAEDEAKMANMLKNIEKLNLEISSNGQQANKIGEDLQGALDLVKDISEVQLKNQQLTCAVSAINSRDDQKIIDDLHRQLEDEQSKLNKCQNDNAKLLEEAKLRDIELKVLKDLNNELESDRKKLWLENNRLSKDDGSYKTMQPKNNHNTRDMNADNQYSGTNNSIEEDSDNKNVFQNNISTVGNSIERQNISKTFPNSSVDDRIDSNEMQERPNDGRVNAAAKNTNEYSDELPFNLLQGSAKRPHHNDPQQAKVDEGKYSGDEAPFERDNNTAKNVVFNENPNKLKTELLPDSMKQRHANSYEKKLKIQRISAKKFKKENDNKFTEQTKLKAKDFHSQIMSRDHEKDTVLDDFVSKKSNTLKFNLAKGLSFENEFRNILEDFIHECSFCFCRLLNTKSQLYAIGHKLCHRGIAALSFQELAYLHKKIYAQADHLLPGCLLDMILSDHREDAERILTAVVVPNLIDNRNEENSRGVANKCCCCKNKLCCDNSEEMLKDRVNKLEKDIVTARQYLDTLKHIPLDADFNPTDNGDSTDTNNSTYRASSPVINRRKSHRSKHFKKLKARIMAQPNIYHQL